MGYMRWLTSSITPGCPRNTNESCNKSGKICDMTICASSFVVLNLGGNSDGGSSWMTSMLIRDNQAPVSCFRAAKQTIFSNEPEGSDMSVISDGNEVIALINSLRV